MAEVEDDIAALIEDLTLETREKVWRIVEIVDDMVTERVLLRIPHIRAEIEDAMSDVLDEQLYHLKQKMRVE